VTRAEESGDPAKRYILKKKLKRDLEISKNHELFLRDRIHQREPILLGTEIIAIVKLKIKFLPK
jgi:hypothetical protein